LTKWGALQIASGFVAVIICFLLLYLFLDNIGVILFDVIIAICYVSFIFLFSTIELKNDKGN
jgi:hypothetical protein